MSSNARKTVPAGVLAHPAITALVAQASATPVGTITPDELRRAAEDAGVEPRHLKALMTHLAGLDISVALPADARVLAATTTKKATTAKAAPAKKAAAKAPAKKAAAKTAEPAAKTAAAKKAATTDAAAPVGAAAATPEAVIGPDGKKILPDVPDEEFEKAVATDPSIVEDEKEASTGFVVSEADDTDEPEQQVMVAGATADPVKDYLKQIGKVPLLNAEKEVELAKRIEAGLFAEEKLGKGEQDLRQARARSWSGSPRTAAARRTTCSRPTSAWSSASPSATPAAACSSWT